MAEGGKKEEQKKIISNVQGEQDPRKGTSVVPQEADTIKSVANVQQEQQKAAANAQQELERKKMSIQEQERRKTVQEYERKKQSIQEERKRTISSTQEEQERLRLNVEADANLNKIRHFIPSLTSSLVKGHCGKIGVIGGSKEYTGAPYFAAITSLKVGADLVYVFCSEEASLTIKSYSPELIVIPILSDADALKKLEPWLARLTTLVIGPGLGRDPSLLRNVSEIIKFVGKKYNIPLIIDADGLYMVSENPSLIENYKGPKFLTPNKNEYARLITKLKRDNAVELAVQLNAILVQKGAVDIITNGMHFEQLELNPRDIVLRCDISGSPRRCGGQGDILAGCLATFVTWFGMTKLEGEESDSSAVKVKNPQKKHVWFMDNAMGYSLAAYAACCIVRQCSKYTFQKFGRSMTATDMIGNINRAFKTFFHE